MGAERTSPLPVLSCVGQRYDKDGILTPWWTNASVEEFQKRQECFVKQYSEYELLGYHVRHETVAFYSTPCC